MAEQKDDFDWDSFEGPEDYNKMIESTESHDRFGFVKIKTNKDKQQTIFDYVDKEDAFDRIEKESVFEKYKINKDKNKSWIEKRFDQVSDLKLDCKVFFILTENQATNLSGSN